MHAWAHRHIVMLVALSVALVTASCTVARTPTPGGSSVVSTVAPASDAIPTPEFKIELPISPTPTQEPAAVGAAAPTDTPGPTSTPRPTKTPWPTRAPTAAPVDDESMVYIEGGEFVFGRDDGPEDESPEQIVQLDGFNIDRYPVTNAEYREFVEATGHRAPRHWKDGTVPAGKEDHPVIWVSWDDAAAYAAWAGKRLPTELEWEKAARGTDGRAYPWGDTFDAALCNSQEGGVGDTSPVSSKPDGASPYGVEDLSGNVWEWTADWYQAYRGSLYQLEAYGETDRTLRGGSWFDGADQVRATVRNKAKPSFRFSTIGFRCAL